MATTMSGKGESVNRDIPAARLRTMDPWQGEVCRRERQQKIGGRWDQAACGNAPYTTLAICNADGTHADRMPVCRECFGEIVKDLAGSLV